MEDAWEFVLLGLIRENNFVWGGVVWWAQAKL